MLDTGCVLLPSLRLRSLGGPSPPLSGCSEVADAVNHVRDTEAWRARTSVMVRWYCLRPSNRGAVSDVDGPAGIWRFARVDEEKSRRIRQVVIGRRIRP
jgi:hypothetical protein